MSILETYILKRVVQMFLTALLPVLGIIWTTQALLRINLVTDNGQSIGSFLTLATFILPTIIPIVLPFALVIGITQTLATMNSDSELTVIDGAGGSRAIIVRPIILLGIVLSLLSFAINNFVEPQVRQGARQMIASAYADLLSTMIEERHFRQLEEGIYVQVTGRGSGRTLDGLFVADTRNPTNELLYYSRKGAINEAGTSLIMQDGEVQRKDAEGNVSIIRFDSYTLDLSELTEEKGKPKLSARDRDLAFLLNPDPEDPYYKDDPSDFVAELHGRFSEWTYPLAFALVSLVVTGGARTQRSARIHPMVPALGICFAIRWGCFYAANSIPLSNAFILLLYAIPLGAILFSIHSLLTGKELSMPATWSQRLQTLAQAIQKRIVPTRFGGGDLG